MSIPPYLWLKDDGGADIKGSVDVKDRKSSNVRDAGWRLAPYPAYRSCILM